MTDDRQARRDLRALIAEEMADQLTTYRGRADAQIAAAHAQNADRLAENARTLDEAIDTAEQAYLRAIERANATTQRLAGAWIVAVLRGGFILLGVMAAGVLALAVLEWSFRWQVAKGAAIGAQIELQNRTLEQLNSATHGIAFAEQDGKCFVLFPVTADVPAIWTIGNRPAIEVQCHE